MEPTPEASSPVAPEPRWSVIKLFAFRFALLYFLLYTHPTVPTFFIPNVTSVMNLFRSEATIAEMAKEKRRSGVEEFVAPFYKAMGDYSRGVQALEYTAVDWTSENVFGGTPLKDRPGGSGDTTHSYIRLFVLAVLAVVGCGVWWLLAVGWQRFRGRSWEHHRSLAPWLQFAVRWYLAFFMFTYGVIKVIPTQMGPPGLDRLMAPYGDSTPMNLAWTFIGSSPAYTVFSGAGEMIAGLLLVFRRTTALGALVTVAVMANVAAINYCYDVPVKLFSTHLLVFAALLCLPDLKRLLHVFVLNRTAPPRDLSRPRFPYFGHVVKWVVVLSFLVPRFVMTWKRYESRSGSRPELYGIWDVEEFQVDGNVLPPLTTDPIRWQSLVLGGARNDRYFGSVWSMEGTRRRCSVKFDKAAGTASFATSGSWKYRLEPDRTLVLEGEHLSRWRLQDPSRPMDPKTNRANQLGLPQLVVRMRRSDDAAPVDPSFPLAGRWEVVTRTEGSQRSGTRSAPYRWKTLDISPPVVPGTPESRFVATQVTATRSGGQEETHRLLVQSTGQLSFSTPASLQWERPTSESMTLRGKLGGRDLSIRMKRRDLNTFFLVRRGFHWINEIPLNRY